MNRNNLLLVRSAVPLYVTTVVFILAGWCLPADAWGQGQEELTTFDPVDVKFGFGDSVYVTDTETIIKHGQYYYLNDYDNHRVLKMDSVLNLVKIMGREGRGPGEFLNAGPLTVYKDSLYIYDRGGMRINVYTTEGEYIRAFTVPYPVHSDQIVIMDDKVYLSSTTYLKNQSSIFIVDMNGKFIDFFEPDPVHPELSTTGRFLLANPERKEIIAVSDVYPFVNRYTASGKLLESYDLQRIESLEPLWNRYRKKRSKNTPRLHYPIFRNAYMDGSTLYIVCTGWKGWDHKARIIKLSVTPERIEPIGIFVLRGLKDEEYMDRFSSICVSGNTLVGYESYTDAICLYDLSELP